MMYMILFVLDDPGKLDEILEAWDAAGIHGATIIESTGIRRKLKQHVPMRYLFQAVQGIEEGNITLLALVENNILIQACLQASEKIVGDLDDPNTGVFAAWPLTMVKGLPVRGDD